MAKKQKQTIKQVMSIKDLIAKKDVIRHKKTETKQLYVKSLDSYITFQKPERSLCMDALDMEDRGDHYLIYNTVTEPNLKDKELQQEFGCVEPLDIVDEVFDFGEIKGIASKIIESVGFGDSVTMVDEIKN